MLHFAHESRHGEINVGNNFWSFVETNSARVLISRGFSEFKFLLHAPPRVARQMKAARRKVMAKTYIVSFRFAPKHFVLPKEFDKIKAFEFDGLDLRI